MKRPYTSTQERNKHHAAIISGKEPRLVKWPEDYRKKLAWLREQAMALDEKANLTPEEVIWLRDVGQRIRELKHIISCQ